jgi:glycine oxidase
MFAGKVPAGYRLKLAVKRWICYRPEMKKVEFLIVGNGLAGMMLAFEMLKHKLDFRIAYSPRKYRASSVAAGLFNPLVFRRLTKSWMADELLPEMKTKYLELEKLLKKTIYYEKNILKPLSEQEKILWKERINIPEYSNYITAVEDVCPVDGLIPAAGYGIVGSSGFVNLELLLDTADRFFEQIGLLMETTFHFGQINPKNKNYETGNIMASKIIFCEGAHLHENPFFQFIKLIPAKGEILLIHIPELSEEFILNKKVFVLPVGNQNFKAGSTYEWDDLSEKPTEKGKSSVMERLDKLISVRYTVVNHQAGIRPTISDRRPVLGIHPQYDNLSVFNGLGTKGVMLAPYFSSEMLKLLTIGNYQIDYEVDMRRFLP